MLIPDKKISHQNYVKSDPKNTFCMCFLTKDWDSVSHLFFPKTDNTNVRLHSHGNHCLGTESSHRGFGKKAVTSSFLLTSENPTTVFHPLWLHPDYPACLCSGLWRQRPPRSTIAAENASVVWLLTGIDWRDWRHWTRPNWLWLMVSSLSTSSESLHFPRSTLGSRTQPPWTPSSPLGRRWLNISNDSWWHFQSN